jgi:hypothetical protein
MGLKTYLWIGSFPHSQHLRPGKHKRSKNTEKTLGNCLKIPMKPLKHPWEIPYEILSNTWETLKNPKQSLQNPYPLVNCHITMENHYFQWVNPLYGHVQ